MVGVSKQQIIRRFVIFAAVFGMAGVAVGAFGAHGLAGWLESKGLDPETVTRRTGQFEVAVRYQMMHAIALLGLAGVAGTVSPSWLRIVGRLMIVGILLFSGSLYLLVALNLPILGAVTPLGGLTWIVAWLLLAFAPFRSIANESECDTA